MSGIDEDDDDIGYTPEETVKPALKPPLAKEEWPIWIVRRFVPIEVLQRTLNMLADKGYQVKDILRSTAPEGHRYLIPGDECFHVVAFDAARIMKKQQEEMQRNLAAMQEALGGPLTPTAIPGISVR